MILISNHLLSLEGFRVPEGAVVRVNLAHVPDTTALGRALNQPYPVFLDYPKGRKKPPTPVITLAQAIDAAHQHEHVRYFAVSNVEDTDLISILRRVLPERVGLVPKIETMRGVANLEDIITASQCKYIMLDGEDLYADTLRAEWDYESAVETVMDVCHSTKTEVLKIYGVVFSEA